DLIEPTLLDELICHIGSLASVYHKPPNAFVEGSHGIHRKHLPIHHGSIDAGDSPVGTTTATNLEQPQVIPSQGDLLGDLLNLDLGPPVNVPQVSSMQMGAVDLLGGGLDSLPQKLFTVQFSSAYSEIERYPRNQDEKKLKPLFLLWIRIWLNIYSLRESRFLFREHHKEDLNLAVWKKMSF
ncbi:AP2B1 isoform 12, partial [Pongo abelii]